MNPVHHSSNNDVLAAPPGVPIEECTPLKVTRVYVQQRMTVRAEMPALHERAPVKITRTYAPDEGHQVLSFWQPSAEELALLNEGLPLVLGVQGGTHPPLWLAVARTK